MRNRTQPDQRPQELATSSQKLGRFQQLSENSSAKLPYFPSQGTSDGRTGRAVLQRGKVKKKREEADLIRLKNEHLPGETFYWPGGPIGILLLHGWTATTAEVRLLAQYLHDRGYTISCPLLAGHGTTVEEMNRCRWQDWAASVENAYQQLTQTCQKVVVGGESMGALLALYLASYHPEISAVLAYAAAIITVPTWMKRILPLISLFKAYRYRKPEPWTVVDDRWKGYPVEPFPAAVQLFRLQAELMPRLPLIRQPILILHGRLDTSALPESAEALYRSVSSQVKELHWLERSHHCVLLDEEWEQAAHLTQQFLERNVTIEFP